MTGQLLSCIMYTHLFLISWLHCTTWWMTKFPFLSFNTAYIIFMQEIACMQVGNKQMCTQRTPKHFHLFHRLYESYFKTWAQMQIQCVLLQMVVICTQCLLSFLPCEHHLSPLTKESKTAGETQISCEHTLGVDCQALPFQATHTPECTTETLVQMVHAQTCKDTHQTIIPSLIRLHVNGLERGNSSAFKTIIYQWTSK